MRITRILALAAASAIGLGALLAPPASAATSVEVNCFAQSVNDFTVTADEEIVFTLMTPCASALTTYLGVNSQPTFAAFVARNVINNTGATITPVWSTNTPTITYVAGTTPGRDALAISANGFALHAKVYRGIATLGSNTYYMTLPGSSGPVPWFQSIGRKAGDLCPATYGPSWAEWMNAGLGGFVCVREYAYDNSTAMWNYRRD